MIKITVKKLLKLKKEELQTKVIVFPTDTVYGIGALYFDEVAIKKIYNLKHRDKSKPIAFLAGKKEDILPFVKINNVNSTKYMDLWPGALTLIFEKKIPTIVDQNFNTIAFRIPNSKVALEILNHFGIMAVTSMNISGSTPLNDLKSIEEGFSDVIDYLVIDEEKASNVSSTILDISTKDAKVIRVGELFKKIDV